MRLIGLGVILTVSLILAPRAAVAHRAEGLVASALGHTQR